MAEVKLKNGYLKISNSLYDNLYFRNFTKREILIVSLIVRLSYGFNHKTALIKPKTWFCVAGLYKSDINSTLTGLINKRVIISHGDNVYSLNKNYDEWLVNYPKNFNERKFMLLKSAQFGSKQNTNKKVSETLTQEISETLTNTNNEVSKTLTKNENELVNHLQNIKNSKQNTNNEVSKTLTKNENELVNHLQNEPEETTGASNTTVSKNIIKDILNTSIKDIYINTDTNINADTNKTKKFDPYFNNPIVENFKKEYEKKLKIKRCYLDNFQINKLTEISIDNPDFAENIPLILDKFSKIKFSNGIGKPSLKWLINDGNWARILNGECDQYIDGIQNTNYEEESWKL